MSERLELVAADVGDIIHRRHDHITQHAEPLWVMQRCEHRLVGYYCDTHRCDLSGLDALVEHIDAGDRHVIAVYCPEHRRFEAADAVQLAALEGGRA